MVQQIKKHIDLNKKYKFRSNIKIVEFQNRILIIAVDSAKWIVLDNKRQLEFFNLLLNCSISDAIKLTNSNQDDIKTVITQIEARHLEEMPNKRVSKDGITMMHLYLTNACNLRCPHCYMSAGKKNDNELSLLEVKNIIDNFHSISNGIITLSGGEVTMRQDFEEICAYAYNKGVLIDVLTNGVLWTDDMINRISPYVHRIQISIDGYNEEENAKIRGASSFNKSIHTMEQFLKNNVSVEIAITPAFSDNLFSKVQNYVDFARLLEEKYPRNLKITFNGELMDGRDVKLTDVQRNLYADFIRRIGELRYGRSTKDLAFIGTLRSNIIKDNCAYGNLTIASNGDVYLCAFIPTLKPIGNIRTTSFNDLIALSNKAKDLSNVDRLIPCNECELKYICGGECRIHHFPEMKNKMMEMTNQCARKCTQKQKEEFYELMIRLNSYFYS